MRLLTKKEVEEQFPDIPQHGFWYELIDFSEREYGSDWGFYGFNDGEHIHNSGGMFTRIRDAGDAARVWKADMIRKQKSRRKQRYEKIK